MIRPQEKSDFESLARLNAEPSAERFLNWVIQSRDHYLQRSMEAERSRDERITDMDKAQVLNDMLETMEKAHDIVKSFDQNPNS